MSPGGPVPNFSSLGHSGVFSLLLYLPLYPCTCNTTFLAGDTALLRLHEQIKAGASASAFWQGWSPSPVAS